jgi:hypothetical protein
MESEDKPHQALILTERPKDARDRLLRVQQMPDLLERICEVVANGGSLVNLCRHWTVSHRQMFNWIKKQPCGQAMYDEAIRLRHEYTDEMVAAGLHAHAQSNIKDLFDSNGDPLNPHYLSDEISQSIESIKITERHTENGDKIVTRDYKLVDKLKSSDMLLRTRGKYLDKVEHSGSVKLEDILTGVNKKDE